MDATSPPSEAPSSPVNDSLDRTFFEDDHDSHSHYPSSLSDYDEKYEGSLDDPDAQDKLRLYSVSPNEIEEIMLYTSPADMNLVRDSLEVPFDSTPTNGLGKLDGLPVEINIMILHHMDLLTFFRFRQVNLRARELASQIKEYSIIAKHAPEAVRAMLRTRVGHTLTINRLYRKLLTHRCTVCGVFGSLLNLATAERCCIHCNRNSVRFHVLPVRRFCKVADITPEVLSQYAKVQLRTLPGLWDTKLEKMGNCPSHLVPMVATAQALFEAGIIDWFARRRLWATERPYVHRLMVATPFPSYDPETDTIQRGNYCRFCRKHFADYLEEFTDHDLIDVFDADEDDEYMEPGEEFDEMKPQLEATWLSERISIFSRRGLLTHLEKCSHAQEAWNQKQSETDD